MIMPSPLWELTVLDPTVNTQRIHRSPNLELYLIRPFYPWNTQQAPKHSKYALGKGKKVVPVRAGVGEGEHLK